MAESLSEYSQATLSANQTLSSNLGSATSSFQGVSNQAASDIGSLLGSAFDALRSAGFDGVVGLNTEQVSNMQTAIKNYVDGVQTALSPLNAADASKAFGPQIGGAVQNFVANVKAACEACITNMNAFNEDLTAVKTAMEAKAASMSTAINSTGSSVQESASSWTYSGDGTR